VNLLQRIIQRYEPPAERAAGGYWEGVASNAAVVSPYGSMDSRKESVQKTLVTQAQQAYITNGPIFAIILVRMMLLSEARFKFRALQDKKMYGDETLRILEYPWPNGTSGELWARMEQDVSLAGNCYMWKAEEDLLVRLPPQEVFIISEEVTSSGGDTYRHVIGYDWDPGRDFNGLGERPKAQYFTVDEVAHWSPIPDPMARWRGMSWCTPVLREIYADTGMTSYKSAYVDHGTPITSIKYPVKLKPETIDAIQARVTAKYGGVANFGRPLVVDQGADPILGKGLQDLDFANVQSAGVERLCSAGGVDPIIIGLRGPQANEVYQAAIRRFGDLTARPLWRSGCAALQKLVPDFPAKGVELWFDTSDIAALQAAETERAQVSQVHAAAVLTLIQAGFTRESVIAAVTSGDFSLLVPDPNAPTPGVNERQTINVKEGIPVTGPESGTASGVTGQGAEISIAKPSAQGVVPAGSTLTKPQTKATKVPMPSSIKTPPSVNGRH
jgi:phage portal protein BeeE